MIELLGSIPLAVLILVATHEAGRLVLHVFHLRDRFLDTLEYTLVRCALGLTAIELVVTLLAWAHILYRPVLWILFLALLASAFVSGRQAIAETVGSRIDLWREIRKLPLNAILVAGAVLALLMDFVLTCVPTTAWDALTYHYPLPAIWLNAHGFIPRLDICYSELPCANEMLFAFAFGLGGIRADGTGIGPLAANHLTWAAGFFSVLALIAIGRRLGASAESSSDNRAIWNSFTPGLVAAVAFLSLPIVYVEEMEGGYIDNFVVFFSLLALIVLLEFKEKKNASLITVLGLLAGALLASKHTSLFLNAIIIIALIVWIVRTSDRKALWKDLGWAIVPAIAIPLPWYLKSFMHTGDPFWPFLSKLINPDALLPDIMYWSNPNVEHSIFGFITYIPRLTWDESLVQVDFRLLSWYFLPLLPFTIYWSFGGMKARLVALTSWIMIALIYILAPGEPRYILVAWALYAVLGAWGLFDLAGRAPWIVRLILPILLIIPIGLSLVDRTRELNNRVPTILGLATVDDYFEKSLDIWPLIRYINEETEPGDGVVMVEPRIHYIQRTYIVWYPFPTPPTKHWDQSEFYGFGGLVSEWRRMGMRNLMLAYGPNYRAIALASSQAALCSDEGRLSSFFAPVPGWVFRRAIYAERGMFLNERGRAEIDESGEELRWDYDVRSIDQIAHLFCFAIPVFSDERSGMIFRFGVEASTEEEH